MSTEGAEAMNVKKDLETKTEQLARPPLDLSKPADVPAEVDDAPTNKETAGSNGTQKPEPVASLSTAAAVNDESSETAAAAAAAAASNDRRAPRAWDTTDRKVVIHNVLKFNRPKEVKIMLDEWLEGTEFRVLKHKKPPKGNWIQITLESVDMVEPFMEHMQKKRFTNKRGKPLFVRRVDPKVEGEDGQKKRARVEADDDGASSKRRQRRVLPKTDNEVRDAITPLWRLSYEEQLKTKMRDMINNCAVKIVKELKGKFRALARESKRNDNRKELPVYDWINQQRAVDVQDILPSPKQTEYRNKCEVNFGYHHELLEGTDAEQAVNDNGVDIDEDLKLKKTPAVGFMASGWSGGVSSPHCCQNVPPEACAVADIVNDFLATSSIPPYDAKQHRGVWRTLTIRTSHRTKECMLVIVHAPASGGAGAQDGSDDYTVIFEAEKQRLVSMLTERDLPSVERRYPAANRNDSEGQIESETVTETCVLRVTSIYFQEFDGLSHPGPEHPVQHVYGKETLREKLGDCTFHISPGAFFQVNTEGAEVLYAEAVKRVKEVTTNPEETLLFDVCCGTGTIGLTCMKEKAVGRVVGVDISEPAIEDAKINASLNGFGESTDSSASQLTRFVASRAESVLYEEIAKVRNAVPSIVAVVDPAREGLHPDVVRALRLNSSIRRIVYVSCNPTGSLVRDAGLLCGPPTKKYTGAPFRPTSAQPVDMFPLTPHCELVITFDRMEST
jgi:tRNA (uracil-5-)-methyltransferase